ncbi:MAG: hypothetical protein EPO32_11190 [Anaerolineae bacterium]|nr:MAG: hypothetical protein EPO32_11190 [Anaerolineae bacterium]
MSVTFIFGLFLAITFFSAGIAIGGTFFSFRKKDNPPAASPSDSGLQPAELPGPARAAEPEPNLSAPAAAPPPHPDLNSLARLYRHGPSGRLLVDFNGQMRAIGQDLSAEQHTALSLLMLDISDWLGAPPPTPADLPPAAPPAEPVQPPASSTPAAAGPQTPTLKPPSTNPVEALRAMNAQRAQSVGQAPAPTTLAGRINVVLQELLEESELRREKIEIRDALSGGVLFVVSGQSYEFIDQVPPGPARDLIQTAIKEWELRNER